MRPVQEFRHAIASWPNLRCRCGAPPVFKAECHSRTHHGTESPFALHKGETPCTRVRHGLCFRPFARHPARSRCRCALCSQVLVHALLAEPCVPRDKRLVIHDHRASIGHGRIDAYSRRRASALGGSSSSSRAPHLSSPPPPRRRRWRGPGATTTTTDDGAGHEQDEHDAPRPDVKTAVAT